jgi:hypothetical protein
MVADEEKARAGMTPGATERSTNPGPIEPKEDHGQTQSAIGLERKFGEIVGEMCGK